MKLEQLTDVLDCGDAQSTWQELVYHLKFRAAQSRDIARDLERDARDATAQAEDHRRNAVEFENLAEAMKKAPVTFPKTEKTESTRSAGSAEQAPASD